MVVWLAALALVGASGARADDASVTRELRVGAGQIASTRRLETLERQLARVLARLRRERGSTPAGERARRLAIAGFEATLTGIRSRLDFIRNDSGEVAAATRDARRADRYGNLGSERLRAAGVALKIRIAVMPR
jgi:hypothetical protein